MSGLVKLAVLEPSPTRIAIYSARDPARLAKLRTTLRDRFLAFPLCDGEAYWVSDYRGVGRWHGPGGPGSFSPPGSEPLSPLPPPPPRPRLTRDVCYAVATPR